MGDRGAALATILSQIVSACWVLRFLTGKKALHNLKRKNIKIDKAFLSHTGLSVNFGATLHNSDGVAFGKAVMKNSTTCIGVYPSDKIGRNSIHSVCEIGEYDLIITDDNVSEDFVVQMSELKIEGDVILTN